MRGPIRCVVIAGLAAACGDDASMPASDAPVGGGLVVAWTLTPVALPDTVGRGVTRERAPFGCHPLRVVGDAAPGDPRTTSGELTLAWAASGIPRDLEFRDAPGGLYSQVSLLVDGHVAGPSIELHGTLLVGAETRPFRITDDSPFSITLDMDAILTPPRSARLTLDFDFAHTLEALDVASFDASTGTYVLATGDPGMPAFRAALASSIHVSTL